tara:strand:- start:319 stop:741 length:423 start_codon:yes stop_codon:yes gene_type:complete
MTKKQIETAIRKAFLEAHELRHLGNRDYLREMHDYQKKLQRKHNADAPYGTKTDSLHMVACYFVINQLRTAWEYRDNFRPRDILHCQESYITAHALVDAYPERVQGIIQRMDDELELLGIHWQQLGYTHGQIIEREEEAA